MGLILVIGVSILVFALAATAAALAVNGISQSRQRTGFERSLAVAESGVNRVLSEVQGAYTDLGLDYPVPGPISAVEASPWCAGTPVTFPTTGDGAGGVFSTEAVEKSWAQGMFDQLRASPGNCIQTSGGGQYLVFKPVSASAKTGRVYALSAIPSFAAPTSHTRLIKSEYIFMPFRPTHAILAASTIDISASTTVTVASGVDPSLASVHSNGTITGVGNPTISGLVTSAGVSTFTSNNFALNPGGVVKQVAAEAIPRVSALDFYRQAATNDPAAVLHWHDLCPTGEVREYGVTPCTGALVGTATASTEQLGWKFKSATKTWTATSNAQDGTYYAHWGNIETGPGNGTFAQMTLVAEAKFTDTPPTCATKQYGNISWDHYSLSNPAYHSMWMLADTDIVTTANFSAGSFGPPIVSGMFIAGDQIQMETSSQGAVGSIVTANNCASPSSSGGLVTTSQVKNPAVYFDPESETPFASIITTSLWLDYSGG